MAKKKRKSLPRGNLAENTRGNLKRGKYGVMGPRRRGLVVFQGVGSQGQVTTTLPVSIGVKPPHEYHPPPGGENAGLPEQGPPGSEWWNQPQYRGRR